MTYVEFLSGIGEYSVFFEKGLKKQANKLLFKFAEDFKANVGEAEADEILFRFCREYLDEKCLPFADKDLPFQITELLNDYISRESEKNKMPHLRWAFQLFGKYRNPHDPNNEHDPLASLKKAYYHPKCDQLTAELYFNEQIEWLDWGAHHFPDCCIIARDSYITTVEEAEKILKEKKIKPELTAKFRYYVTLYKLFYEWSDSGRKEDFAKLCEKAGLEFHTVKAFYYKKTGGQK